MNQKAKLLPPGKITGLDLHLAQLNVQQFPPAPIRRHSNKSPDIRSRLQTAVRQRAVPCG